MNRNRLDRRGFLKVVCGSTTAAAIAFVGCKSGGSRSASGAAPSLGRVGEMTYRKASTSGDRVSLLGYGCMRWPTFEAPAEDGNVIDQEAVNELVDYAIEHGVNYFDTSPAYLQGWSEQATGIALKRHPREAFYVATKLSNFNKSTWGREASMEMYRNSFVNLQVEVIDYYLLHAIGLGGMDALHGRYLDNGMLDLLIEERTAGRIRHLGFSYHGDIEVFDYLLSIHERVKWNFVQIQLNYLDWNYAKESNSRNTNASYLYAELTKRAIPAVIMEPLLGGRLANLPDELSARLKQRRLHDSIASWAFRYAGSFPEVLTVLSGMTYMEHLQDNLHVYSPLEPLDDDELAILEDTARVMMEHELIACTSCQYCMPCPYGIDIPTIFQHYNRCICQYNVPQSSQDKNYQEARRIFLVGYDRSVPKLRQANHCIGCNKCTEHCPQAIKIPEELHRIDAYVEKLKQETL